MSKTVAPGSHLEQRFETLSRRLRGVAVILLISLQIFAMLVGTLLAPRVWSEAVAGDSVALTIIAIWSVPPILSVGLGALRNSTNPLLWWFAYLLLGLGLLYVGLATFAAYGLSQAIHRDGFIT